VNTFPDQPFSSYFSGNTVQICPVGALLAVPYRFRARPWDLEQVESTCTQCAVGCRVAVQSSRDKLTRYLGLDSDPVNHGWLCDKGRFSFEAVNSDQRLGHPLVRQADTLVQAAWADALDAASAALSDARTGFGGASIAVIGGSRLANEDAYAWAKLAKGVLGTDSVDCQLGDGLPAEVVLGLPRATIDETCAASTVILLAPDLKEELPVLYLRVRGAALESKVPLVEIASTGSGLSKYATHVIGYQPGEAVAAVRRLLDGDIDLGADPVVVLGRPSVAESADAVVEATALLAGIPGVRFLSALRRGNVHGALDAGLAPGVLPGRITLESGSSWFADGWGRVPTERGLDTTGILRAAAAGELQALVLLGADPLGDFPDRALAKAALERVPFVLAIDTFLNESVRLADVVLPAATFAERPGTTTNLEGRVTRLGQKITAPEVAWPDWMIAVELAARLGDNLGFLSLEEIVVEMERLAPVFAGVTTEMLAARANRDGLVIPLATASATEHSGIDASADPMSTPGVLRAEEQGQGATAGPVPGDADPEAGPDSDEAEADAPPPAVERPAMLVWDPTSAPSTSAPKADAYKLRLVTGRKLYDAGVMLSMSPSLAPLAAPPVLRVHPTDLERLGVTSGGTVRLRSNRLTVDAIEVVADHFQPRGTAGVPFNLPGLDIATLLSVDSAVAEVAMETV
ncbi:MAG: molybdopterin-dependent oxidoreductase, partial [Actinomycetota bacterium]|nr:molybdopterin-dependent oxidoreductase [Actinomycetota bacterium]